MGFNGFPRPPIPNPQNIEVLRIVPASAIPYNAATLTGSPSSGASGVSQPFRNENGQAVGASGLKGSQNIEITSWAKKRRDDKMNLNVNPSVSGTAHPKIWENAVFSCFFDNFLLWVPTSTELLPGICPKECPEGP